MMTRQDAIEWGLYAAFIAVLLVSDTVPQALLALFLWFVTWTVCKLARDLLALTEVVMRMSIVDEMIFNRLVAIGDETYRLRKFVREPGK